jgi:hypothetical protein
MIKLLAILKSNAIARSFRWHWPGIAVTLLISPNVSANWIVNGHSIGVCDDPYALYQTTEETEGQDVEEEGGKEDEEEEPDCD